jgi:hypothetical protein
MPDNRTLGLRLLNTPKPPRVREELLRMKARMPAASCRFLAATFNRRFRVARRMTVGQTYVAERGSSIAGRSIRTNSLKRPGAVSGLAQSPAATSASA